MWRSLVARFVRDEEVVGSNPATPTYRWPQPCLEAVKARQIDAVTIAGSVPPFSAFRNVVVAGQDDQTGDGEAVRPRSHRNLFGENPVTQYMSALAGSSRLRGETTTPR